MNYWKAYWIRFTCAVVDGIGVGLGALFVLYAVAQFV
jgi:hypothetical protein